MHHIFKLTSQQSIVHLYQEFISIYLKASIYAIIIFAHSQFRKLVAMLMVYIKFNVKGNFTFGPSRHL